MAGGSDPDLGSLMMAEVDVPLEDIPDSCEDVATKNPRRPCNDATQECPRPPPNPQTTPDKVSSAAAVASTPATAPSALPSQPLAVSSSNATRGAPPHAPLRPPAAAAAGAGGTASQPAMPAPTKSKKKKSAAAAALGLGKDAVDKGENVGRWTAEEHRLFLQGLEQHGKGWKKIASLIKTRSVVQIRTHAQKYFQKLAKARQNGEEGDVTMEGRGGISSAASLSTIVAAHASKRRRPATGTKRKVIQSIVGSAIRHGKKLAALQLDAGIPDALPPLPAVAPVLAHFIIPSLETTPTDDMNNAGSDRPAPGNASGGPSVSTVHGIISGPALEESIFRFLTPAPVSSCSVEPLGSDIARQAGAYPITVPSADVGMSAASAGLDVDGGEVSPTSVADLTIYPSWTDAKDTPSWYAKGSDVDDLLEVGEALDWLEDTGDLNETYHLPPGGPSTAGASDLPEIDESADAERSGRLGDESRIANASAINLPRVDSNVGAVVPPLPSLFDGTSTKKPDDPSPNMPPEALDIEVNISPGGATALHDVHLQVFENPMEEQEFVSTILETE